ncbi:hypothetical protein [Massilia eurypsychrophila]|nr:hypothetical protein [Massilia eurypsychrophila]
MYLIDDLKPDGRALTWCSRAPITSAGAAPSPGVLQAVTIPAEWTA